MTIKEAIGRVIIGHDLNEEEMYGVMNEIMSGDATPAQIGAFITALRMKGECVDEITGAVRVMREKATPIETGVDVERGGILMDIVGTGGDGAGTFNISTTSSFVVAAAGIPVAKHGNRAVSSHCGSADVLEALGVDLSFGPEIVEECIQNVGIGFLFAPLLHKAMRYAIGPRREIGVRTIFNILGPMTNPAKANMLVVGVFDQKLTEPLAKVLARLGTARAVVVHGEGGLDELTITGKTYISELKQGRVVNYTITPEEVGLTRSSLPELKGGATASESAEQLREVLAGSKGPKRDMVLLNSGAALMLAGLTDDIRSGTQKAASIIDSGDAVRKLEQLVAFCEKKKLKNISGI